MLHYAFFVVIWGPQGTCGYVLHSGLTKSQLHEQCMQRLVGVLLQMQAYKGQAVQTNTETDTQTECQTVTRTPVCRAKLMDEFRPAKLCAKQFETLQTFIIFSQSTCVMQRKGSCSCLDGQIDIVIVTKTHASDWHATSNHHFKLDWHLATNRLTSKVPV